MENGLTTDSGILMSFMQCKLTRSYESYIDETVVLSQCLQGPATNPNGQFSSAIIVASYVEVLLELEQTKEDPETHAQLASFVRTSASC